ncbi:MAG: tetratricopeptide repeat protein [Bacteroidales bacterium]|nr:tetratricopeptide repeat protein [Bacteroidales bacterium]
MSQLTPDEQLVELSAQVRHHPRRSEPLYQRGKLYTSMGRGNDAIVDLRKAIKLKGDVPEYYTALGDAYFTTGNVGESYQALRKALELDPDNTEAHLKMGEIAFYSRDYDRALESLSKVTAVERDNRTALFMKAFVYKEKGDTVNAVQLFRRVIDLYPDYEPAYEEIGLIYADQRNPLGVDYLTTAIQLDSTNVNARYALGLLYQDLEDALKAEAMYRSILAIDPQNTNALHNLGYMEMIYFEDYERAVLYFDSVLAIDPAFEQAVVNRNLAISLKKK